MILAISTGLLTILLNKDEKLKKSDNVIDPVDVINIAQCALDLFGNAHIVNN